MFGRKILIYSAVIIAAVLLSVTSITVNNIKYAANETSSQVAFTKNVEQKNAVEGTLQEDTSTNSEENALLNLSQSIDTKENEAPINEKTTIPAEEMMEPIASSTIINKQFAASNTANEEIMLIASTIAINDKNLAASNKRLSRGGSKPTNSNKSAEFTISGSLPTSGRISSNFGRRWGRMHKGLDIAAPTGTDVFAFMDGEVVFSGRRGGYGNLVILDHGHGVQTYYAHNSKLLVEEGQKVSKGTHISEVGSTGNSTGPHCHFEIRKDGTAVNPAKYIK
jgi:murein DD-endopeptidase MepM/ murein hydrolase activator NlpD